MSYAQFVITIVFFVNLFVFLAGQPDANSPMLGLLKTVMTGSWNINWDYYLTWSNLMKGALVVGLVAVVAFALSPQSAAASILTGSNYTSIHAVTVIAIALFITLVALPNFDFMGIPEPINTVIQCLFGMWIAQALIGLFRGE